MTLANPAAVKNSAMFPFGCKLRLVVITSQRPLTHAIPIITVAPAPGAGRAGRPPSAGLDAAAGVGPLWKGVLLSDTGAESRRTLI